MCFFFASGDSRVSLWLARRFLFCCQPPLHLLSFSPFPIRMEKGWHLKGSLRKKKAELGSNWFIFSLLRFCFCLGNLVRF